MLFTETTGVHIIHFNINGEFGDIEKMLRPEQAVKALGQATHFIV